MLDAWNRPEHYRGQAEERCRLVTFSFSTEMRNRNSQMADRCGPPLEAEALGPLAHRN